VLAGLSFGCGRLVELAAGERLPGPLVLPVGFALVILAGEFATLTAATAQFAAPLAAGLAIAGLLLGPIRRSRPDLWALGAALAVFAVFAAPIVLSGEATFAGYIKLDDTATYFAMTDRVMEHARDIAGLAPSTYEATLATTLAIGYPTGVLMPIGIGHALTGYDIAWLYQPYIAYLATMLALTLYALLGPLVPMRPLRAFAVFVAAQPAILFGYAMWGGIKELAGAWLFALLAVLVPWTVGPRSRARAVLPLALVCAAIVCVLSLPAVAWLAPAAVIAGVLLWRRPVRSIPMKAGVFAVGAVVLAVPAIVAAIDWLPKVSSFRDESELGNLFAPLSKLQAFGIWPVGDFRVRPSDMGPTYVLIAVVVGAGLVGLWWAWRRGAWELPTYLGVAALGSGAVVAVSSPWVSGKAIAMASPAFLAAALAGCAALFGLGRRVEATVLAVAITGGVLWSNTLAYHDVSLAPRGQLHELETIGNDFAGQGPALMTAYEPYGARHFLRREDPEGASELRRRFDYLNNGQMLEKGESADVDRFQLPGILAYRTLVLRRGPSASRPPSVYRLVRSGRYYEVWQRPASGGPTILEHLSLGSANQAAAVPRCADVLRLARKAQAAGGYLATATRPTAIPVLTPSLTGTASARLTVPEAGRYTAWLAGDWFGNSTVTVDGHEVGSKRAELNWPGLYTDLGNVDLGAGRHTVALTYDTGGLYPGSGGPPFSFGPLTLGREDVNRDRVLRVAPSDARTLCSRSLDWIEAVR
jgi:hypothetical protein